MSKRVGSRPGGFTHWHTGLRRHAQGCRPAMPLSWPYASGPSYPCLLRNLMAHTFPPLHTMYLAGGAFHSPHLSHPSPKSLPALPCLSGAVYAWLLKAQPTAASFLLQPWFPPTQRTRSSQSYAGSFRICLLLHLTSAQLSRGTTTPIPWLGKLRL